MSNYKVGDILEKHYYSGHNPIYTFYKVKEVCDDHLICVRIGTRTVERIDTQSSWRTVYAPDPSNETSKPFYVKIGYSKYYHLENIALDWNKVMKRYEPLLQSNVNETFTRSWAD